jgi:hypothetical protein
MWIINGFIGAIETVKPRRRCFAAGAPVTKKVLGNGPFREGIHILLEPVLSRFT